MRSSPRLILGLTSVVSLLTTATYAQGTPSQDVLSPKKDTRAITIVKRAIDLMGTALPLPLVVEVIGSAAPSPGSSARSGRFVSKDFLTLAGSEFRREFRSGSLTSLLVSGHGKPSRSDGSKVENLPAHVAYSNVPVHLPVVVLAWALTDPSYSLAFIGQIDLDGELVNQIRLSQGFDPNKEAASTQVWSFSVSTGLPARVVHRVVDIHNVGKFEELAANFADFRRIDGHLFPFKISNFSGNLPRATITIESLTLNGSVAQSEFELSAGTSQ